MRPIIPRSFAVMAALAAASVSAGEVVPSFGWGATIEKTRQTLSGLVSVSTACAFGWNKPATGCQALVIKRHRLGRYNYLLELQHHPVNGLNRIVVVPTGHSARFLELATTYAILVFDAALAESHGRLASSPVFRHAYSTAGKSGPGYEWIAHYGPPSMRVKLHARVVDASEGGTGLAIER